MTTKEYLIVGQGVAGSFLAFMLWEKGKNITLIDNAHHTCASKVAAGICNAITGKRFTKTWLAEEVFPFLHHFYQHLENNILNTKFYYPTQTYYPFEDIQEQNTIFAKSEQLTWKEQVSFEAPDKALEPYLQNTYGGWICKGACTIDTHHLLARFKDFFAEKKLYLQDQLDHSLLKIDNNTNHWLYKDQSYQNIIFCEGTQIQKNPFFNYLPFKFVKGEIITIELDTPLENFTQIINKGIFIAPIGKKQYKVGATYNWDDLSWQNTEQAKEEIETKLKKILKTPYKVIAQEAGIRPATYDRRPFIGKHPQYSNLWVFNGFGTKAFSLVPYLATQFIEHLIYNKNTIPPEANIERVKRLFLEKNR